MSVNEYGELPRTPEEERTRNATIAAGRAVRAAQPAYQNTTDALEIAVKALFLAASNARLEGAPPGVIGNLRIKANRLSALRHEIVSGRAATGEVKAT